MKVWNDLETPNNFKRGYSTMDAHEKKMYVHSVPVRVWHWINAVGFLLLILTGVQIRYAETISLVTLNEAITLHNYVGFIVVADYFVWVVYYLISGKVNIYIPNFRNVSTQVLKQIRYYGYGVFIGDPNPHVMSPTNKFNALQQQAYLSIMIFLVPAQIISGLFLWKIKGYEEYINLLGGIKVIDTIHVVLFFFFVSFIIIHCYLSTLGRSPMAHFKSMFTGYEEHY